MHTSQGDAAAANAAGGILMVDQGLTSCMSMAYTPCYSHINGNMIVDAEISLMGNYLRIYILIRICEL